MQSIEDLLLSVDFDVKEIDVEELHDIANLDGTCAWVRRFGETSN